MVWRHCPRARAPRSAEPPLAGSQTGECEQGGTPAPFRLAKLARPFGRAPAGEAGSCKNQPGDFAVGGPPFSWASRSVGAPARNAAARESLVHISIFPHGRLVMYSRWQAYVGAAAAARQLPW